MGLRSDLWAIVKLISSQEHTISPLIKNNKLYFALKTKLIFFLHCIILLTIQAHLTTLYSKAKTPLRNEKTSRCITLMRNVFDSDENDAKNKTKHFIYISFIFLMQKLFWQHLKPLCTMHYKSIYNVYYIIVHYILSQIIVTKAKMHYNIYRFLVLCVLMHVFLKVNR